MIEKNEKDLANRKGDVRGDRGVRDVRPLVADDPDVAHVASAVRQVFLVFLNHRQFPFNHSAQRLLPQGLVPLQFG